CGPQPPNVRLLPFAPQREILSRCALAVHHGGFSSTMECLSAGAPQLVVPLTGDQGSHADAVTRHGLGSVLRHALGQGAFGVPLTDPARLDPQQVLTEARALAADPAVAGRVADFRRRVDELPGPPEFVAFVEELAGQAPRADRTR
ncbi:MAG TPA: nucleotide disphospho-sugar-binding domain-containing protein, partial [Egibacteraceae bacterium]|nr:nucleotide disphospho-sugar-binding domain-containing protein [Egibacteraceae bacterium]